MSDTPKIVDDFIRKREEAGAKRPNPLLDGVSYGEDNFPIPDLLKRKQERKTKQQEDDR